jgi:hypothetical protein
MHKEVPMSRTRRHRIDFDFLEGKVLLSTVMTAPAAIVHQQKSNHFHLDGKLRGIPSGTAVPNGFIVSSFPLNGNVASMGNVEGTLFLKYSFIQMGKLPDLSKSSLVLTNQKGSVTISLNASGSHHYKFTIMYGSGLYTFASEKGTLTLSGSRKFPDFTIKM